MTTIKATAEIDKDGTLSLRIPTNLPAGPVEAILVVQSLQKPAQTDTDRRSGAFDGIESVIDIDRELREIRHAWEAGND